MMMCDTCTRIRATFNDPRAACPDCLDRLSARSTMRVIAAALFLLAGACVASSLALAFWGGDRSVVTLGAIAGIAVCIPAATAASIYR